MYMYFMTSDSICNIVVRTVEIAASIFFESRLQKKIQLMHYVHFPTEAYVRGTVFGDQNSFDFLLH